MAPYLIRLQKSDGSVRVEQVVDFDRDDDAIDHAGWIPHPHVIDVWQSDRHVAKFPPLPLVHAEYPS